MQNITVQEKALKEYDEKSRVILQKMLMVLVRAHRKLDDKAYLKVLQKLEKQK